MISWPSSLVDDIARRRAIIFLGAGVSKNAIGDGGVRPPSWLEFLKDALDVCSGPKNHIKDLLKQGDYLTVCELLKDRLDDEWVPLIQRIFVHPKFKYATIHEDIYSLDSRLVLTQNFDKIYDVLSQQLSDGTVSTHCYYDSNISDVIRGRGRAIIKVHGTVDNPSGMIFSRSEYASARHRHAGFYALMDALAATHTFVFLGCSLSDPDINLMLERYSHSFQNSTPHYIVMPKPMHSDIVGVVRKNLNLKVILYSPANAHEELAQSVSDLVHSVEQRRDQIATRQDW